MIAWLTASVAGSRMCNGFKHKERLAVESGVGGKVSMGPREDGEGGVGGRLLVVITQQWFNRCGR